MNNLQISNKDGQLVVSSRQVSENFEKEHAKVNRSIENLIEGIAKSGDTYNHLFIESHYQEEQNKQTYKEYLLTRDGFSLLVMGFTGSKALEWKLKYIKAFNDMEQSFKNGQPQFSKEIQAIFVLDERTIKIENKVSNLEDNMPLFNVECKELQALVKKIGIKALGGYKCPAYNDNSVRTKIYKDIQHQLKREFGIDRYEAIKRVQLDTAKIIVSDYKVPMVLVNEIEIINNQIKF